MLYKRHDLFKKAILCSLVNVYTMVCAQIYSANLDLKNVYFSRLLKGLSHERKVGDCNISIESSFVGQLLLTTII